jgi:alginate O-acetyltransferase complex protein AlgI
MVFSSVIFLLYFLPIVLTIYFLIPRSFKNVFLLLASIVFYAWGAPKFIFVVLGVTTLDFYLVRAMSMIKDDRKRKLFLLMSLSLNLGLLFYFKYCNFFIENVDRVLNLVGAGHINWVNTILPIGISFYTFETLTYVVDVYRKEHKPLSNFLDYQLYILLFPKLIAGPIIRFSDIADQITDRFKNYNPDMILLGISRFSIGLAKKVLIANVLAKVANDAFSLPTHTLSSFECWLGILAYTFQIYFDFSGYSDMAIGLGKMFGFTFMENFDDPYTSKSITEFWKRWHISLGNWMKRYLYIPLGGNRVETNGRLYFNLWLVFVLSGLWHGAAWTFVIWGIYHGLWLVLERMFFLKTLKKIGPLSVIISFTIVTVGWVFFRADTTGQAFSYIARMFVFEGTPVDQIFLSNKIKFTFGLAFLFSFFTLLPFGKRLQDQLFMKADKKFLAHASVTTLSIVLFALAVASITSSSFNPFIYFRF